MKSVTYDPAFTYCPVCDGEKMEEIEQLRTELAAAQAENLRLTQGIENCRLLAARNRKEAWALLILGFCAEAGVVGSITR